MLDDTDCDDDDANLYPGWPPARILGTLPAYYLQLQTAYDLSFNDDTIQSKNTTYNRNFYIDMEKTVFFEGGYDCTYTSLTGPTTFIGDMIVNDGGLLIIRYGTLTLQ